MDIEYLITKVHDKAGDEELMSVLRWWFDMSDQRTQLAVADKLQQVAYKILPTEAEAYVKAMKPAGQYWTMQQIREFIETKGIKENCTYYYLVMNMMYNDYKRTAQIYGLQNDADFYFNLARDFIEDFDAKPYKVERYFEYN